MPLALPLPTTSHLIFQDSLTSSNHPSLPTSATYARNALRNALKQHKRLSPREQSSNLNGILSSLNDYLPYLFALDAGLSGKSVAGEEIDILLEREPELEWRPSQLSSIPRREAPRVKGRGLDYELCFVLTTLAYTYIALSRKQQHSLYAATTPTTEQRVSAVSSATKYLLQANSIHSYLSGRAEECAFPPAAVDILSSVQNALASLTMAEATLLAVFKDDPYPAAVIQERNKDDKEWMIKPPDIPKVRAHLFARLSLGAAEHAARGHAMLARTGRLDETVSRYLTDVRKTARGKACRFLAIDADLGGETGKAIAWLRGGKKELGFAGSKSEENGSKVFSKFKKEWAERREDKKIEKGGEWGSDAGRLEELRVIEMLERKWVKMNDTMNTQIVPPSDSLLISMPTGREIYSPKPYVIPCLDESVLARMRAPLDEEETARWAGSDPSSSDNDEHNTSKGPVGAFPGTKADYAGNSTSYY